MLYEDLQPISPKLAAFLQRVSPELSSEEIQIRKAKGIPKSIQYVGRSYLFSYKSPLGKGTRDLPYYHMFPMIINLEHGETSMLGLNPFYLPPPIRTELVEGLLGGLQGEIDDPDSRSKITYKIITKYRRSLRNAFPCIKRYDYTRMSSVVLEMPPKLWKEFYLGKTSKLHETFFSGSSPSGVWADSKRTIMEASRRKRK
tara:strand:- start:3070 stop:3669 length:600 start_codon:yes stop_codon:yes gene_type:complete